MLNKEKIAEEKISEFTQRISDVKNSISQVDEITNSKILPPPENPYAINPIDYVYNSEPNRPFKTHCVYEKKYQKSYQNFYMMPVIFIGILYEVIIIDFKMNITLPLSANNYVVEVYINADIVKTYQIGSLSADTNFDIDYYGKFYCNDKSNIIFIKVKEYNTEQLSYSPTVYVEKVNVELWGTNVCVLKLEKKYNVTCFNSTYFITKSTGLKTYLMEKTVGSFNDIDENDFVEVSGAHGLSAQVVFTSKKVDGQYVFDKKLLCCVGPNGEYKLINLNNNQIIFESEYYDAGVRVAECLPHKNSDEFVLEFFAVNSVNVNSMSSTLRLRFNNALTYAEAQLMPTLSNMGWFMPVMSATGNIDEYIYPRFIYAGLPRIGVGLCDVDASLTPLSGGINGVNATAYYMENNPNKVEIFANVFGKCVRCVVEKLESQTKFTVLERKIIGVYDYFFRGAQNDYFIVVNGELKYYKKQV